MPLHTRLAAEEGSRSAAAAAAGDGEGGVTRREAAAACGAPCRFHITVSKRFLAKRSAARDALSHSLPGGGTGGCGGGQAPALRWLEVGRGFIPRRNTSASFRQSTAHPGRGEAGGLDPRRRPLPVAGRIGRSLRVHDAPRAR